MNSKRIQEIQEQTGYPESHSVMLALDQVWNEVAQEYEKKLKLTTPESLAVLFHGTYERLAHKHGYETRKATKLFNRETPNGKLMIEVCKEILNYLK